MLEFRSQKLSFSDWRLSANQSQAPPFTGWFRTPLNPKNTFSPKSKPPNLTAPLFPIFSYPIPVSPCYPKSIYSPSHWMFEDSVVFTVLSLYLELRPYPLWFLRLIMLCLCGVCNVVCHLRQILFLTRCRGIKATRDHGYVVHPYSLKLWAK